jgi:acyl-coenzyme A synthetase/AMP-(fatty) acid ligase
MPRAEDISLWDLTRRAAPLAGRFIAAPGERFPLCQIETGSILDASLEDLAGKTVILRTAKQLSAVATLLELDGVAKRLVICTPELTSEQVLQAADLAGANVLVSDNTALFCGTLDRVLWVHGEPRPRSRDATRADTATEWVLFTSGTTGIPKMAMHTLQSLIGAIGSGPVTAPGMARPKVWSTFYDVRRYGGLQIFLRAMLGGGSLVLSDPEDSTEAFLGRAAVEKINFLSGTPTHWRRALLSPMSQSITPEHVRLSGEVADQSILDRLAASYPGSHVRHAFASTEAGVAFEVADGQAGFPSEWIGQHRNGVDLAVRDGTLRIRSSRTARCYVGNPPPPLMEPDGYVDTKDLVTLRDGRYYFVGRRDGVINIGGLKVHPEEVEAVLHRHPIVTMARAHAKRSAITGTILVADVVLSQTRITDGRSTAGIETSILSFCRQELPPHKVPATLRIVDQLEMGDAGKLRRSAP